MRILLVEDDPSLGSSIQSWLQLDGYAVDWIQRGDQVATALAAHDYQCLLLDRGLPGLSGDAVLKALRAGGVVRSELPVIIITASYSLNDRVQGLDLGADDYLVKPFDLEELSARVRAVLRRGAAQATPTLTHGAVALNPSAKWVTCNGQSVTLTAREFAILHALMRHPTHILSRSQLEESLYGWGQEVESNAIEVHIYKLRKKLGNDYIVTVRNQGYILAAA